MTKISSRQLTELDYANSARAIWDSVVGEFFNKKKEFLLNEFQRCTPNQVNDIVNINITLKLLNELKNELNAYIETGQMVQIELDIQESQNAAN